jgi:hypothetical protein
MTYPFHCDACGYYVEVVRPYLDAANPEVCKCGATMHRVWTVPQLTAITIEPWYSPAHGKFIGSKRDLREANKAYEGKHGSELLEVGTDRKAAYRKPKKQAYELPREVMAAIEAD